jgi:glycosyltransferase involved in cell wall biosynthesis
MRVTLVNYGHGSVFQEPEALLDEYHTLTGWAVGLRDAGATVTVVQGFDRDARLRRGGIDYRFVRGSFAPRLSRWSIPVRMHQTIAGSAVAASQPDVVHLNGLLYALQVRHLRRLLPGSCAVIVQHHAEKPWRGFVAPIQRWGLKAVDGFFFAGREMARSWREQRMIRSEQPVFGVMEGSSPFSCGDRSAAQARTGFKGCPIFLWAANLVPGKDPLTVLDGFEKLVAERPSARLYMAYRSTNMLALVQERIASRQALRGAVKLLGWIPHEQMEDIFNSADFLVQGSTYEGSGYAVVDALACGVVPVVTDIPSFRFMIGNDAVGALWRPHDAGALLAAIRDVTSRPIGPQRRTARALFEQNLSYTAIGRQALAAYRELVWFRTSGPEPRPAPDAAALADRASRRGGR